MQLSTCAFQKFLEQKIGLRDELHVAIFHAVVNHLHIMACSSASDPFTAGKSVFFRFGRDRLKNRFYSRPRIGVAAWHDGWPVPCSFLPSRNASANKHDALFL